MTYTSSPQADVQLQPSELPPGCTAPLCAPADGKLVRDGQIRLLRLVRFKAGHFVLYVQWEGRNCLALRDGVPQVWRGKPTPNKLRRVAESAEWARWSYAPVYTVPHLQSGRTVFALGMGFHPSHQPCNYVWVDSELRSSVAFTIESDERKSESDNLKAALNASDSFASYACRWLQAPSQGRSEMWRLEVERRAELEQLMKWVVWCLPEVWEQGERVQLCSTRAYSASEWFFIAQTRPYRLPQLSPDASAIALRWGQFWQPYFLPIHALSLQELNWKLGYSMPTLGATIHPPTAHQQLEARLNVRDWLSRNAPEQINELLLV